MTAAEVRIEPHRAKITTAETEALEAVMPMAFEPAVYPVRGGFVLLAGERRWTAMVRQYSILHVWSVRTWSDFFAWMLLDARRTNGVKVGLDRRPMNFVDAVSFVEKVKRYLPTNKNDYADQVIAEYLGLPVDDIRQTRYITNWTALEQPEDVRVMAHHELGEVAAGRIRPTSAYDRVKRYAEALEARRNAPPAAKQRAMLGNLAAQSTGLVDALQALGPLSDELEPAECETWITQLGAARRAMERVIRALKERSATQ